MTSFYTRLRVVCDPEYSEILMAELAEAGFETFMETDTGLEAYAEAGKEDRVVMQDIRQRYEHVKPFLIYEDKVKKENWNKEWEKNVEPVVVEGQTLIRAAFHEIQHQYPYEIIITPKMSFGTGHHQTTYLMIKAQMSVDHEGKTVMDAGCGTGILSVMAVKRGARLVEAFDIDDWSMENGRENADLNNCPQIRIRKGTIRSFTWPDPFDVVLANINKNVLLDEMPVYAQCLKPDGVLLLSGFYETDIPDLQKAADVAGLELIQSDSRDQWANMRLRKRGS